MIPIAICLLGVTISICCGAIGNHLSRIADYLEEIKNNSKT